MHVVGWNRLQFGFTISYHYLFPQLTMGLALLLVVFKTLARCRGDERLSEEEARQRGGEDAVYYGTKLRGSTNAKAKAALDVAPRRLRWSNQQEDTERDCRDADRMMIERAVILSPGPTLEIPVGELGHAGSGLAHRTGTSTLAQLERGAILIVLEEANWLIAGPRGAAARLGMKRTTLQPERDRFRPASLTCTRSPRWLGRRGAAPQNAESPPRSTSPGSPRR
jgi:Cytochrome bd terminal oxidase subunit I